MRRYRYRSACPNYFFKDGFLLGEEQLQTLTSKIKERYPEEELIYRITKSDSYIYHTTDIQDIFAEENGNANYIKKLEVIIDRDDIRLMLCFEKNEDTFLRIVGVDRDKIYLLYNELKQYIAKEITTVKMFFDSVNVRILSSILLDAVLISTLYFFFTLFTDNGIIAEANKAIESSDITTKLNFIIEVSTLSAPQFMNKVTLLMYSFVGFVAINGGLRILRLVSRKNSVFRITDYFLFGRQKEMYEKKVKLKNNVIWSVLIAFIVGIVASAVVTYFTK